MATRRVDIAVPPTRCAAWARKRLSTAAQQVRLRVDAERVRAE